MYFYMIYASVNKISDETHSMFILKVRSSMKVMRAKRILKYILCLEVEAMRKATNNDCDFYFWIIESRVFFR